jgi:hypothetical protein
MGVAKRGVHRRSQRPGPGQAAETGAQPVPATMNWPEARGSVELLAPLRPSLIAAGHGLPTHGAAGELARLAKDFRCP